jgi:hypothetical protein
MEIQNGRIVFFLGGVPVEVTEVSPPQAAGLEPER